MMRTTGVMLGIALCVVLAGCDSKDPDAIAGKTVDKLEEMVNVLKGIKDEASSKAAAQKIKSIVQDLRELKKEGDAAGKISQAKEQQMKAKYQDRIQKAATDMRSEGMRIGMNPKLATPELMEAMREMSDFGKK
jgi:hypothetical protein